MRLNPAVADGAEVTTPWASIESDPDEAMHVTPLSRHLRPLGIQGVRPRRTAEAALAGREQEIAEQLIAEQLLAGGSRRPTAWCARSPAAGSVGRASSRP